MQKLSAKLSKWGPSRNLWKGEEAEATAWFTSIDIYIPAYMYGISSVQEVTSLLMVTNCSGERSLFKIRMVKWKKEHH